MILQSIGLRGGYGNSVVLESINLQINSGEWLTILGPNGSGKSTLLKLLSRVLAPKGGVVLLDGKSIHTQAPKVVAQQLALLPQSPPMPEGLTVKQMVSLGRNPYQSWWQWELDGEGKSKVSEALYQTNLLPLQDRPVEQLSGGQKQRAFLALALAQDTDILLLDEPTTFLDIHYQLEILDLLRSLQSQRHLTIVTVLHDINLAMRYSDRVALMHQGRLYAVGSVDTVLTKENLRAVFNIDSVCMDTPIGKQIVVLGGAVES
ncbi:MAG: ABC transporter ATP-binding protein [Pseudanabaenaceae cyanobacterium SKYGB_i_bin29]|nr:ABC transporter ATP-binding protein [Pseudanabaenaceae cyanobacterium SKYG29]MDW8421641.1 ABC transporter ATP-binding protein [Pseudanabaenaceae cyanobacterium SKYGB_i_bin29]